ncbi:MAG: VOC family protein [Gammaproteobacteria bacterium]
MAKLSEIVIDSLHPAGLARFWAAALTGYHVRPYDEAEVARLTEQGLTPETDPAVAVDGPGPTLFFQLTGEAKTMRNRVHVDLLETDRPAEVARLVALGATVRDVHEHHTVMLDPEGNEFCVRDPES